MSISKDTIFASFTTRQQRRAEERRRQKSGDTCTPEQLATEAMRADQAGQPGAAELMREMMKGSLGLIFATKRPETLPDISTANGPMIIIIGDDDHASTGPSGWACSPTIAAWASCAVIHAAGATAETYREAIRGAYARGKSVLVETDSAHAQDWAELFRPKPTLIVLPYNGVHPILPNRGSIH